MWVSSIEEKDVTPDVIDGLLFRDMEDAGQQADCMLVLGSEKAAKYRVPVAVAAYRAGRAAKMLLCGGVVRDFPTGRCSEAEEMRKAALASGMPEEDIMLESASQNTVENILFALIALQRTMGLHRVRRVLLITTAYHMRRSLAIARYLFPRQIAVLPCPAQDLHTQRNNWMLTPEGKRRAIGEAMNIVRYVKEGVIPDFEISV